MKKRKETINPKPFGFWTKEETIKALQERKKNRLPLNRNNVLKTNGGLLSACLKHFNTYENAINSAGFDYDEVREDTTLMSYYGMKFEKLLGKIFNDLNKPFVKDHFNEIQPDYIFPNSEWADAKLSLWTDTTDRTIEKYEPHCDNLTIVYLRGNKSNIIFKSDKTTIKSVYNIIEELSEEKKLYYLELLDGLWKQADEQEAKIEKVELIQKSDYRGVQWRKDNQKWGVAVTIDNKRVHLGMFDTEIEAAKTYDTYILHNKLNKPLNFGKNILAEETHQSRYYGVSWLSKKEKWISVIQINKKRILLGTFHTEIAAAKTYNDYVVTNNIDRPLNKIQKEDLNGIEILERHKNIGRSDFKGISWNTRMNRWKTEITTNKKRIFLGYYDSENDAAMKINSYIVENNIDRPLNIITDFKSA